MSIARSWERISDWHETNTRPGLLKLNEGASADEISRFESAIGSTLPDDVRVSFMIHNGGIEHTCLLWYELLPLSSILERWKSYNEWQKNDGWGLGKEWEPLEIQGMIKPVWWMPKRIPLLDADGDQIMLDLDPPEHGNYGQIIEHSHEIGPTSVLATSWTQWLNQLANDLEAGKYIYVAEEDTVALPGMYD